MKLAPRRRMIRAVSLVPLVDVLLILLVFFMVTSTYLNLDYLPMVPRGDAATAAGATAEPTPGEARMLLVTIRADGRYQSRGETLDRAGLEALFTTHAADRPTVPVVLLPSGGAQVQAMVSAMEAAKSAGVTELRVVRMEGQA